MNKDKPEGRGEYQERGKEKRGWRTENDGVRERQARRGSRHGRREGRGTKHEKRRGEGGKQRGERGQPESKIREAWKGKRGNQEGGKAVKRE